ncbi:MAG: hypothetical protein ACRBK7_11330 [Acidimicrobiales bacterium]
MRLYRRLHMVVLGVVMFGVCVLTLSDTLVDPATEKVSMLFDVTRYMLERLSPQTSGVDLLSRPSLPLRNDTIGHFVAWTGVGFVAAGIPTTAINRFNMYFGLFALSAFLEAGQRYLSWSRVAEFSDLVANGLGLAVGFVAFGLVESLLIPRIPLLNERTQAILRRA